MAIKSLVVKGTKFVDCFYGMGWKNWVRIKLTNNKPIQIDSTQFSVPDGVWSEIVQTFSKEQVNV